LTNPTVVVIDRNTQNPVKVLRDALGPDYSNPNQPPQIVELRTDLDLTGETRIVISDNRSLVASAELMRSARALGPRVYVRDERGRSSLFLIRGDNVLVSGFRLEGPTDGIGMGERYEMGIEVSPAPKDGEDNPLPPVENIEICNMEIFHWSGVGIQVADNALPDDERELKGRLNKTNPGAVRVRHCYIHHNRHGPGYGYGVESTAGAYVLIERNVFDENRHAIAGGPKKRDVDDYSGYTARENMILAGGGVHCADRDGTGFGLGFLAGAVIGGVIGFFVGGVPGLIAGALIGGSLLGAVGTLIGSICWYTHQIDMHGTKSTSYQACCGTAGETIIIERNTILYTGGSERWLGVRRFVWNKDGYAIRIRGNPLDKAVVDGNVFVNDVNAAIRQNGENSDDETPTNPITVLDNNVFNADDPCEELLQGNFEKDIDCGIERLHGRFDEEHPDITPEVSPGDPVGPQDDFMATGVTWWARSRATGQWRYLNTMKERVPQLQIGTFTDDDISDVGTPRPPHADRVPVPMPPEKVSKSGAGPWIDWTTVHP
jgi:hypothetical protein